MNPAQRITLDMARIDGQAYAIDTTSFDVVIRENGQRCYIPPWYARPQHKGKPLFEAFWGAHDYTSEQRERWNNHSYA